jgi:hypothetical protein
MMGDIGGKKGQEPPKSVETYMARRRALPGSQLLCAIRSTEVFRSY